MDQRPRNDELEHIDTGDRTVSRRAFFGRARLGLLGVTGVVLFGIATSTGGVSADEETEKEKKKTQEPRDKDRDEKEKAKKEKDEKPKETKSKKSDKNNENKSNTKKKKSKNGDDSNKKKTNDAIVTSPYAKYVEQKKDRYGCPDFANQSEAQQVLRLAPKDPNNLDGNRNGIACDGQDAFMDGVAGGLMKSPFDLTPVSRP